MNIVPKSTDQQGFRVTGEDAKLEPKIPSNSEVREQQNTKLNVKEGIADFVSGSLKSELGGAPSTASTAGLITLLPGQDLVEEGSSLTEKLKGQSEQGEEGLSIGTLASATLALSGIHSLTGPKNSEKPQEVLEHSSGVVDSREQRDEFIDKTRATIDKIMDHLELSSEFEHEDQVLAFKEAKSYVDTLLKNPDFVKYSESSGILVDAFKELKGVINEFDKFITGQFYEEIGEIIDKLQPSSGLEDKTQGYEEAQNFVDMVKQDPDFIKYCEKSPLLEQAFENLKDKIKEIGGEHESNKRDVQEIQKICQNKGFTSIQEYVGSLKGEPEKLSRRAFTELTHSYLVTPEGRLMKQYHKTIGSAIHQSAHSGKVKLGKGGFKRANIMEGGLVRGVIHRESADLSNAIAATKVKEFKNCPYLIVGNYMTYTSEKTHTNKRVFLAPFMSGGDMENKKFTPKEAASALLQASKGLRVMHDKGWAHFDIKPANILFTKDNAGNISAKLGDMDLASEVDVNQNKVYTRGTPGYCSPAMLKGVCRGEEGAKENDIFSLGVTILEVAGLNLREDFVSKNSDLSGSELRDGFDRYMKSFKPADIQNKITELGKKNPDMKPLMNLAVTMIGPNNLRPDIDEVVESLERITRRLS